MSENELLSEPGVVRKHATQYHRGVNRNQRPLPPPTPQLQVIDKETRMSGAVVGGCAANCAGRAGLPAYTAGSGARDARIIRIAIAVNKQPDYQTAHPSCALASSHSSAVASVLQQAPQRPH